MSIGRQSWVVRWLTWGMLGGLVSFLLGGCGLLSSKIEVDANLQSTAEAERILTETHGVEVRDQIRDFESRWLSLEACLTPSIQTELATGRYLDAFGIADILDKEPFWLVTTSVITVENVRVLEYSPDRFKATACVVKSVDETTADGTFVESQPNMRVCGVYVFVREDGIWKLAGFFNTADPRDWDYAQDWLKEIIGELPTD